MRRKTGDTSAMAIKVGSWGKRLRMGGLATMASLAIAMTGRRGRRGQRRDCNAQVEDQDSLGSRRPERLFRALGCGRRVPSPRPLGVTVSYVVPPTPNFEPSVEMSTIESLVAKGYNAFAIFPDGEASIVPLYNRLRARGIPVIDVAGCTSDPTPALLCFGTDVQASAQYETQMLTKAMGGKGSIAFLTGLLTDANTVLRDDGVKAGRC